MKTAAVLICLLLSGCFSADLSNKKAFADVIGKKLTIQRPSIISPGSVMKSATWGGKLAVLALDEVPDNFNALVAQGLLQDAVVVPVGTELRVERIERRNLVDAGVEILAFGMIRNPKTGKMEAFVHELTRDLGNTIGRAPWEDSTVPKLRDAKMNGIRDFDYGAPIDEKKD
jgi:hypothetical protein